MNRIIHLLPLAFFIVLVVALHNFLDKEDHQLASALLDKSFPTFSLPSLETQELVENRDLSKLPALVNVWATWCITCRVEHPFLMKLKQGDAQTTRRFNALKIIKIGLVRKKVILEKPMGGCLIMTHTLGRKKHLKITDSRCVFILTHYT